MPPPEAPPDAYFDPNERKYYPTRASLTSVQPTTAAHFRNVPNNPPASASQPDRDTDTAADDTELRREALDLKIANRARAMFTEQLKQEREGLAEERRDYVDKLMTFNSNSRLGNPTSRRLTQARPDRVRTSGPRVSPELATAAPHPVRYADVVVTGCCLVQCV